MSSDFVTSLQNVKELKAFQTYGPGETIIDIGDEAAMKILVKGRAQLRDDISPWHANHNMDYALDHGSSL